MNKYCIENKRYLSVFENRDVLLQIDFMMLF